MGTLTIKLYIVGVHRYQSSNVLLATPLPGNDARRRYFKNSTHIFVKAVLNILHWSYVILDAQSERLTVAASLDPGRQEPLKIWTPVRSVMLLVTFIVPKNVDAIEVGLIKRSRLIRTTLLQY